jgi:hypothetical protein
LHPAEATLAEPKRSIDVDDNEPSDAVHRFGCRRQDLSEWHASDEGLRDTGVRPVLSNGPTVAERSDDRHTGGDSQAGELRVTLHPPRGLHMQRERPTVNHAVVNREIAASPERHKGI